MGEYIEREAVLAKMVTGWIVSGIDDDVVTVDDIESIPAADVAHVVRCKDCKHYGGVTLGNVCRRWSAPLAGMKNCTKPDDFCSYGERRDDNG